MHRGPDVRAVDEGPAKFITTSVPTATCVARAAGAFSSLEFVAHNLRLRRSHDRHLQPPSRGRYSSSHSDELRGDRVHSFPFSYLIRILENPETGRQFVLFTLVLVWAGDMLAYFVGRTFGHSRMAPALSPKKTWEGAAANLAASLACSRRYSQNGFTPTA